MIPPQNRKRRSYSNSLLTRPRVISYERSKCLVFAESTQSAHPWAGQPLTPYKLARLLVYLNRQKGFQPPRNANTYLKEAKRFLVRFGEEQAEILILKAYKLAKHPWGFRFLERLGGIYDS